MKKIIFIALIAFLGCSREKIDGISKDLEMKAFADIQFGISKKEYDVKVNNLYKIGESYFSPNAKFTSEDRLYILDLYSDPIDRSLKEEFVDLSLAYSQLISSEYGGPKKYIGENIDNHQIAFEWEYGKKKILLGAYPSKEGMRHFFRFLNTGIDDEDFLKRHLEKSKELEKSKNLF